MTISINVQPNRDNKLVASSHSYPSVTDAFVTFDITVSGEGHVAVFLRNEEDARNLMDAAIDAYRNVVAITTEKLIADAKAEAEALAYNPFEQLLNEDEEYGNYESYECRCDLCIEL